MQSTSIKRIYSKINSIISGEKTKKLILDNIGHTFKDLIFYLPYKLVNAPLCQKWEELEDKKRVVISVKVKKHYPNYKKKNIPYRINVAFDNNSIYLVFFSKFTGYLRDLYKENSNVYISGTLAIYGNRFQILHPIIISNDNIIKGKTSIITLYYKQKAGLKSKIIHKSILKILPDLPDLKEWNNDLLKEYPLIPTWKKAIRNLHIGKDHKVLEKESLSLLRLAYDEVLANQLSLAIIRKSINQEKSNIYNKDSKKIINKFLKILEFSLTNDQKKNIKEIIHDLDEEKRMLRLLHGDVGSGKTIVAFISALHVISSNYQVAIIVPTEILANQHYKFIKNKLSKLNFNTCILTASVKNKVTVIKNISNGYYNLIIGTHSLLQKSVKFKKLSYVIIDEQHRFGVEQRINIRNKGKKVDMLLMSATPIPRTMLLTTLGDISISTVKEKPFNTKIKTILKSDRNINQVLKFIKSRIQKDKVFWICPLIESNENENNISSIKERYNILKKTFKDIGYLHGKQSIEEKNKVLNKFKSGKIRLLISTIVIEVGIDIPNANIILIDHADRFGLAQIHQLRGRVGRGNKDGTCILLYKEPLNEIAKERLKIIKESSNGFDLSEKDLLMRGGGEILGTNQYGFESFIFFNISHHKSLLKMATIESNNILKSDPSLATDRGNALIDLLYLFEKEKAINLISAG